MTDVDSDRTRRRRANLRHLMHVLDEEGVLSWDAQGKILAGISGMHLLGLLRGDPFTDELAREIEWAMNRPAGWLDRSPQSALDD